MQNDRPELSHRATHYRVYAPTTVLGKLAALLLGAVAVVAAVVFSLVMVAVVLVGGLVLGGYLWWRTRDLRRQMREQRSAGRRPDHADSGSQGRIIEGEAIRESGGEPDPKEP